MAGTIETTSPRRSPRRQSAPHPLPISVRGARYATPELARASACAQALRFGHSRSGIVDLGRGLSELPALTRYIAGLPREEVAPSRAPAGEIISSHLALRRFGVPRFRLAQGVLYLPQTLAAYLRGRHRQALRTNLTHAQSEGLLCHHRGTSPGARGELAEAGPMTLSDPRGGSPYGQASALGFDDLPAPPTEEWWAEDSDGRPAAHAWLTVDAHCALLHALRGTRGPARWLLHTAIVERLCLTGVPILLTGSYDAPLMDPGSQYFQDRLGYTIVRVVPRRSAPAAS